MILIRNMADGPRDYPLKSGASVYLPAKCKPVRWAKIADEEYSEALDRALEKGSFR